MFVDIDVDDILTYGVTQTDGAALPDWLTFDAASRTLTSTSTGETLAPVTLQITATDGAGAQASDEILLTVVWEVTVLLDDTGNGLPGMDGDGITQSGAIMVETQGLLTYNLYGDIWESVYTPPSVDGDYTLQIRQVDAAGGLLSEEEPVTFTLDTTAPPMPDAILDETGNGLIGHDSDGLTRQIQLLAPSNTETDAVLVYSMDAFVSMVEVPSTEVIEIVPDGDGDYTLWLRQTDVAGNVSAVQQIEVILDTTVPAVPDAQVYDTTNGLHEGDGLTNRADLTPPTNTEAGAVLSYSLDGGTTWDTDYLEPTSDGAYTLWVRQTDAAGNVSEIQSIDFTMDTTLPAIPDAVLHDTTNGVLGNEMDRLTHQATLTAATNIEEGAQLAYRLDEGAWTTTYTPPTTDGSHTLQIQQTDAAGNTSYAQVIAFTLDTTPPAMPDVVLEGGVSNLTNQGTVTDPTNTEDGAVLVYSLDAGLTWQSTYTPPETEGAHTLWIRQTDQAGNPSEVQTLAFILDTTPPVVPNASLLDTSNGLAGNDSDGVTRSGTPILAPTNLEIQGEAQGEAQGGVAYSLDDTGWLDSVPALLTDGTDDGVHTVWVRQTDEAGNLSAEQSLVFTLDSMAPPTPDATLDDTTDGQTGHASDTLTKTGLINAPANAEETAWVEFSLDDGLTWSSDYTAPTVEGTYGVQVRQTDAAGNVSASQTLSFTLDTTPPTLIDARIFSNNADATTQAALDDTVSVLFTTDGTESDIPEVFIDGYLATVEQDAAGHYTATHMITEQITAGEVAFSIGATDAAGNAMVPVTETTDGSRVTFGGGDAILFWDGVSWDTMREEGTERAHFYAVTPALDLTTPANAVTHDRRRGAHKLPDIQEVLEPKDTLFVTTDPVMEMHPTVEGQAVHAMAGWEAWWINAQATLHVIP